MKLLFSEAAPDYEHYIFPYAIWAFPEERETPADFFESGFLPSTRELDRFYMARQIRVSLRGFTPSSENRRILRKCEGVSWRILPREQFQLTPERRSFCKAYSDARFGPEVMTEDRLQTLFTAPVATHIMLFEDAGSKRELGYVVLYLENPRVAFYYYSFYDLTYFDRNLGIYIMTSAVQHFAGEQFNYIYLGTCYSERALYKTQFSGGEFFNGFRWSDDIKELKYLVGRQAQHPGKHLLETPDYLESFYHSKVADVARVAGYRIAKPASPGLPPPA